MEKDVSFTLMEMFTTVHGSMIKPMERVSIAILTELSTKETGSRTNSMERDLRHGLMVPDMKVNTFLERNMAWENSPGLMEVLTMVLLKRTISKETVDIIGPTEESSKDLGLTIRWKAKVYSLGLMAEDMRETTKTIRKKAKENSFGLMEESMREAGKMENNTEWVLTHQPVANRSKVNGKMERDSTGSIRMSRSNE
jgi:hypothetical protein